MKPGDLVWYYPVLPGKDRFAAVVASDPWELGHGQMVVRLEGLGDDYCAWSKRERRSVPCAACSHVEPRAS